MIIKGDTIVYSDMQAPSGSYVYRGALTAATTTAVGGMVTLQNTSGYDLLVKDAYVEIATVSTGAATYNLGTDTTGTTTSATILAATSDAKVLGIVVGSVVRWKKDTFIVGTASATVAGLVGSYYIEATPIA